MQEENASTLEGLLTALLSEGLMIKSVSEFTIIIITPCFTEIFTSPSKLKVIYKFFHHDKVETQHGADDCSRDKKS